LRACALTFVAGLAFTSVALLAVRSEVARLTRQQLDQPAAQAAISAQHLAASVNQVLATANGAIAAGGVDSSRFTAVFGPEIRAGGTLAGMALIDRTGDVPRVTANLGATPLLAEREPAALAGDPTGTLVASRRLRDAFHLGFAATVAQGSAAVYVEVVLVPPPSSPTPFALTPPDGSEIILGNVSTLTGLTRSHQPVSLGGRDFALLVPASSSPSWHGLSLPDVVLLVGILLTGLATAIASIAARRAYAVDELNVENRALDFALERQRRIEAELRAWQARFNTILRDSPDIIVVLDLPTGGCEVLNRPDFLGYPLDALAEHDGLARLVHPDDAIGAEGHWAALRDLGPEQVTETTLRLRDADGDDRYARLRFSPLHTGEQDSGPTVLGLISDVTEQTLNQLREAELQEALLRSQRLDAVGQLAGGVAHDFNNLLAAVLASVELLLDELPDGQARECAKEIERAATRGAALVRQLLTFAGRDRAEPQTVDLNEIVTGMEPLLRRTLGGQVQLQVATTACRCTVVADPTQLEQVILNLAVNARDAMATGGILWIATEVVFDDSGADNDRVVVSVADTGTGIAPELRDQMFQPFVTTKEPGEGTGLGLATVQSIVKDARGEINVTSKVGEGTTFEIAFPRVLGSVATASPPKRVEGFDFSGRRILLVEDDDAVRSALTQTLERRRFAVTTAAHGSEALRLLQRQPFDVVLTDAVMPGMSGLELVEELELTRPELPVILMSGYSALNAPGTRTDISAPRLSKPFTTAELMQALQAVLAPAPVEQLS
jgi:signal transduction histidine kinase/CheY-like chemotaxis protein